MVKYNKNKKKRSSGKKSNYSIEDRLTYHMSREGACGKFGLEFGGTKHSYSCGFSDAFSGRDNTSAMTSHYGMRSGKSYETGYKVGRKAARKYFLETGKQPFAFKQEVYRKI